MQSPSSFFELLFKKNIDDAGNVDYLQRLTEVHPYFSPAQFYLLQQKEGAETYNQQAIKTAILFNNNYWLNFQLLKTKQPTNAITETVVAEQEIIPVAAENKISAEQEIKPVEVLEEPVITNEATAVAITENKNITAEEITEEKEIAASESKIPTLSYSNGTHDNLLFQPLHVTDYFASQGIKLNEDIQPTDKLGKQLKSFTEWLKTMKKINPNRMQADHSVQTDTAIQTLAEKSNAEGEVLTETMAEVLIQQDKVEKAIEVYQKLSLLNPSKSAYFAAKIEQLKEH